MSASYFNVITTLLSILKQDYNEDIALSDYPATVSLTVPGVSNNTYRRSVLPISAGRYIASQETGWPNILLHFVCP